MKAAEGDARLIHGHGSREDGDPAGFRERFHLVGREFVVDEENRDSADEVRASHGLFGGEARHEERGVVDRDEYVAHEIGRDNRVEVDLVPARRAVR